MKKNKVVWFILALVIAVVAIIAILAVRRFSTLHKDITGVTTLTNENLVIMNSPSANVFVSGSGQITVKSDKGIHVEYAVTEGSFDLAFTAGSADPIFAEGSVDPASMKNELGLDVFRNADLSNLTADGEIFGASGVSGKGSLDFAVSPGVYSVYFNMHDTVGTSTVSAKK